MEQSSSPGIAGLGNIRACLRKWSEEVYKFVRSADWLLHSSGAV